LFLRRFCLLIEEKIHKNADVYDACVYGARQPDGSQRPAAAIALVSGSEFKMNPAKLKDVLNAALAPDEQLQRAEIMDWKDFPIGITGKTMKRIFRLRTEPIHSEELEFGA
jgi:long-chain acyl-CoA synthetase